MPSAKAEFFSFCGLDDIYQVVYVGLEGIGGHPSRTPRALGERWLAMMRLKADRGRGWGVVSWKWTSFSEKFLSKRRTDI